MSEADREREEMAIEQAVASLRRREMKAARLQLTCAALTGLTSDDFRTFHAVAADAVAVADACLALLYPSPSASDGGGGERG